MNGSNGSVVVLQASGAFTVDDLEKWRSYKRAKAAPEGSGLRVGRGMEIFDAGAALGSSDSSFGAIRRLCVNVTR